MNPDVLVYVTRAHNLREMGFGSYHSYLTSDLWEDIRLNALGRTGNKCVLCKRMAGCVHHLSYDRQTLEGEKPENLVPLCFACHKKIEVTRTGTKRTVAGAKTQFYLMLRQREKFPDGPPNRCLSCNRKVTLKSPRCKRCRLVEKDSAK